MQLGKLPTQVQRAGAPCAFSRLPLEAAPQASPLPCPEAAAPAPTSVPPDGSWGPLPHCAVRLRCVASHGTCRVWARRSAPLSWCWAESLGSDTRRAQGGVHVGGSEASVSRWRRRVLCRHEGAHLCGCVSARSGRALPGGLRSAPGRPCWAPGSCLCPLLGRESGVGRGRLLLPVLLPALQHRRGRRVHVQHEALPARHLAVPQKVLCPRSDIGCGVPGVVAVGPGGWEGFRKGWAVWVGRQLPVPPGLSLLCQQEPSQRVRVSLVGPEWRAVPPSRSRAPALVARVALKPVPEATGGTLAASCVHMGLFGRVMLEERKVFRPFLLPWMVAQPVDSGQGG